MSLPYLDTKRKFSTCDEGAYIEHLKKIDVLFVHRRRPATPTETDEPPRKNFKKLQASEKERASQRSKRALLTRENLRAHRKLQREQQHEQGRLSPTSSWVADQVAAGPQPKASDMKLKRKLSSDNDKSFHDSPIKRRRGIIKGKRKMVIYSFSESSDELPPSTRMYFQDDNENGESQNGVHVQVEEIAQEEQVVPQLEVASPFASRKIKTRGVYPRPRDELGRFVKCPTTVTRKDPQTRHPSALKKLVASPLLGVNMSLAQLQKQISTLGKEFRRF